MLELATVSLRRKACHSVAQVLGSFPWKLILQTGKLLLSDFQFFGLGKKKQNYLM